MDSEVNPEPPSVQELSLSDSKNFRHCLEYLNHESRLQAEIL